MIFLSENTNTGGYSANYNTNYVKEKHDLYKWTYPEWPDSEPTFGGLEKPGFYGGFRPNGYNENCYINDGPFVPDLSGKSTRPRQFGWGQSDNWYTHCGLAYMGNTVPTTLLPSPTPPITDELFIEKIKNIGFWNSGFATSVLISPRHYIAVRHAFNAGLPQLFVSFVLKDGTVINRVGTRVERPENEPASADNNLISGDILLFRLSEEDSLEEYVNAGLITVYNDYISPNDPEVYDYFLAEENPFNILNRPIVWMVEGGERVLRSNLFPNYQIAQLPPDYLGTKILSSFDAFPYLLTSYLKSVNKKIDDYQVGNIQAIPGDSGSPLFCYDKISKKTILLGINYVFGSSTAYIDNNPLTNNLFLVQQELQNNGGYSLNKLNINDLDLVRTEDFPLIDLNPPEQPPTPIILPSKPYSNSFKNINTSPLNKYPYSSRIYSNGQ